MQSNTHNGLPWPVIDPRPAPMTHAQRLRAWREVTPRHRDIENALDIGRIESDRGRCHYTNSFMGSLAQQLDSKGALSPRQCAAVLRSVDAA